MATAAKALAPPARRSAYCAPAFLAQDAVTRAASQCCVAVFTFEEKLMNQPQPRNLAEMYQHYFRAG